MGLKANNEVVNINFNEQVIEVKQYLPTDKKIEIITNVLESSHDQNNFSNPVKVQVYTALEIIDKYTNITFTEKQKEDVLKLYDLLSGNGIITKIVGAIPQEEYDILIQGIYDTIDSVYKYKGSVLGILEAINQDYKDVTFDTEEIQKTFQDKENITLLKDIMAQLG